jgi:hypothetical protein
MSFFWQISGKEGRIGLLGIGILGATVHNCTQLAIASFLFIQNSVFLWQAPFVIIFSLVSGGLIGALSFPVINAFQEVKFDPVIKETPPKIFSLKDPVALFLFLGSVIGVFFVSRWEIFLVCFILLIIVSLLLEISLLSLFKPVIKFWGLFMWNFALNLFFTSGRFWFWIITVEGIEKSLILSLRLIYCIAVSSLFVGRFGMDYPLYLFSKITGDKNTFVITAGALEALPKLSGKGKRMKWKDLKGFKGFLEKILQG